MLSYDNHRKIAAIDQVFSIFEQIAKPGRSAISVAPMKRIELGNTTPMEAASQVLRPQQDI